MNDRGMIKWAPFSAVVPGTYLVREIELEKHRIKKPCLDEDKVTEIEKSILEAYNNHDNVKLKIYRDGRLYIKEGKILHLDGITKTITMSGNYKVFFGQIIDFM